MLRVAGSINPPGKGAGMVQTQHCPLILHFLFLGKQWPPPLTPEARLAHGKLLPRFPLEKQSWHTPSVFPGAWLVEPSASVAGADWLGRPWAPSGPASGCPGFFVLEPDGLAAPFFLSWFFIVVCNARLGADPMETNTCYFPDFKILHRLDQKSPNGAKSFLK